MSPMHLRPLLAALVLFGLTTPALSLGLGEATPVSALGEPLLLNIPVTLDQGEPLGEHCFRLSDVRGGKAGDVPAITGGALTVRRTGVAGALIEIRTREVIDEPMVALGIETRCGVNLTRDYAVLLSPRSANDPHRIPDAATEATAAPHPPAAMPPASRTLAAAPASPAARGDLPADTPAPGRPRERLAGPPTGRTPAAGDPVLRASLTLSWPASPRTLAHVQRRERLADGTARPATLGALAAEADQLRHPSARQEPRWTDHHAARPARNPGPAATVSAMPASLSFPLARGETSTIYRFDMPPPTPASGASWPAVALAMLLTALAAGFGGYQASRILAARAQPAAVRRRPVRRRPRA